MWDRTRPIISILMGESFCSAEQHSNRLFFLGLRCFKRSEDESMNYSNLLLELVLDYNVLRCN